MFDGVKGQFVAALGDGHDPNSIPRHYIEFYDSSVAFYRKFGHFQGSQDVPHNDWPMLCLIADLKRKIADLEQKIAALNVKPEVVEAPPPRAPVSSVPTKNKKHETPVGAGA